MSAFGRCDAVELIDRQLVLPEVHGFFPQGYFDNGGEDDEIEAIRLAYPFYVTEHELEVVGRKRARRKRRRQLAMLWAAEAIRPPKPPKPPKPSRYHYLPSPPFTVAVEGFVCSKVGPTWLARGWTKNPTRDMKFVMLRKVVYDKVLAGLSRLKYQQVDRNSYVSNSFNNKIAVIRLWNFYDPDRREQDPRFFWVQTIFNS